jgi:transcriptional regulator with XRE-family HTH domain
MGARRTVEPEEPLRVEWEDFAKNKRWVSYEPLRTRIAHWRVWRSLTQERLAELTGIPRTTLQRIERGETKSPPPLDALQNIAIVLSVPLVELIDDEWFGWTDLTGNHPEPPESPSAPKKGDRPDTLPTERQPQTVARAARTAALAEAKRSRRADS